MTESVVSGAPQGMLTGPLSEWDVLTGHADDNLIIAHRLGEWISKAPELELDIALGNIGLDHLGVARALYRCIGLEEGKSEDDYAMGRTDREFRNLLLVEQPNGDFAHTIVRQFFFDSYQLQLWPSLLESSSPDVAGVAAKAMKEAEYHHRFSSGWMVRMGDGTEESHRRAQDAVDSLWKFTDEIFDGDARSFRSSWDDLIDSTFAESNLEKPEDPYQKTGGRVGYHTEHLGYLLTEMQWMQRTYPGLEW